MPTEDRRILFSNEEVYKALYALCSQKQLPKPVPGHITAITQDAEDTAKLFIQIENPQNSSKSRVEYSRDFMAAALLLFCRGLGIPIAKAAQKSVLIKDGQVTLRIVIG